MPDIKKYFPNSKVTDWTGGSFGAAGGIEFYGEGGNVNLYEDPSGQMWVSHEITATGNFTVKKGSGNIDYMIVGGGGGGGWSSPSPAPYNRVGGGGGGAGGYGVWTDQPVSVTGGPGSNGVYPIVIGAGGTSTPPSYSLKGNDSSAFGNTRNGGGVGAVAPTANSGTPYYSIGGPGASGGGGVFNQWGWSPSPTYSAAGTGNDPPTTPSQGSPGGLGAGAYGPFGSAVAGGGGGGASNPGAAGTASSTWPTLSPYNGNYAWAHGGTGGAGTANTYKTGSPTYYAGGGGGGAGQAINGTPAPYWGQGVGGSGGGGYGMSSGSTPADPYSSPPQLPIAHGTANTGGGGGGGQGSTTGSGGSGVVILRYKV